MRIVVAEDSELLRAGLIRLLKELGHQVIAEVADADALVSAVVHNPPDLALIDVRMPPHHGDDGLRAAIALRRKIPELAVVILSQYIAADSARALLSDGKGAAGYLLKDRVNDIDSFASTLERVAGGAVVIDPEVISEMLSATTTPTYGLTRREIEVMGLIAEGLSNQGIADRLVLSIGAVEKNITSIYDKLALPDGADAHRRVLAVRAWLDAGN